MGFFTPPQPPPPEKEFEVLRAVKTLRHAFLRVPGLSDAAFAFLAGNPDLQALHIVCPDPLTDGVLVHLAGLEKLETLTISHSPRITGRGMAGSAWLAGVREVDFLYASLDKPSRRVQAGGPRLGSQIPCPRGARASPRCASLRHGLALLGDSDGDGGG